MPPPLDLTGRRFGRLTVLRADGRVKWGGEMTAWLCRCECGAELRVPQNRLPHRESIPMSHRVEACDDCRARPCEICGAAIPPPSTAATCSKACRAERKRRYQREYYHKKIAPDEEAASARSERMKARYRALSAEQRTELNRRRRLRTIEMHGQAYLNEQSLRRWRERMENEEGFADKHRDRSRRWAEENPEQKRRHQRASARRKREEAAARELGDVARRLTEKKEADDE